MAWGFFDGGGIGAGSATSGTTLAIINGSVDYPARSLVCLGWCCNVAGVTATAADDSTQAGAANSYTSRTAVGGTTLSGGVIWCFLTRQVNITTTDTITVTFSGSASRRACTMIVFSGGSAPTIDQTAAVSSVTASPISMGATAALAAADDLAVGFTFWKGGAVLSGCADATAGYTHKIGISSSGLTTRVEANASYDLAVGTAGTSDSQTFTSFTAGCGELVTFKLGAVIQAGANFSRRGLGPVFA